MLNFGRLTFVVIGPSQLLQIVHVKGHEGAPRGQTVQGPPKLRYATDG